MHQQCLPTPIYLRVGQGELSYVYAPFSHLLVQQLEDLLRGNPARMGKITMQIGEPGTNTHVIKSEDIFVSHFFPHTSDP
jgi:hypothetical protein